MSQGKYVLLIIKYIYQIMSWSPPWSFLALSWHYSYNTMTSRQMPALLSWKIYDIWFNSNPWVIKSYLTVSKVLSVMCGFWVKNLIMASGEKIFVRGFMLSKACGLQGTLVVTLTANTWHGYNYPSPDSSSRGHIKVLFPLPELLLCPHLQTFSMLK